MPIAQATSTPIAPDTSKPADGINGTFNVAADLIAQANYALWNQEVPKGNPTLIQWILSLDLAIGERWVVFLDMLDAKGQTWVDCQSFGGFADATLSGGAVKTWDGQAITGKYIIMSSAPCTAKLDFKIIPPN